MLSRSIREMSTVWPLKQGLYVAEVTKQTVIKSSDSDCFGNLAEQPGLLGTLAGVAELLGQLPSFFKGGATDTFVCVYH